MYDRIRFFYGMKIFLYFYVEKASIYARKSMKNRKKRLRKVETGFTSKFKIQISSHYELFQ